MAVASYLIDQWQPILTNSQTRAITQALEQGEVIYLPQLPFELNNAEQSLLNASIIPKGQKNISYDAKTQKIGGLEEIHHENTVRAMMHRYRKYSNQLLNALCPQYHDAEVHSGRTSFRPVEIRGRLTSYRKDDTRLHVDAFPSMPVNNLRILRVFTNINPYGEERMWKLGEPYQDVIQRFLPKIRSPWPLEAEILHRFKITKKKRMPYDHYMLNIHNAMKKDMDYQKKVLATSMSFPPGSTWIVYTDVVSHAALQGRFVLEQTYYPPIEKMLNPATAPQKQLLSYLHARIT